MLPVDAGPAGAPARGTSEIGWNEKPCRWKGWWAEVVLETDSSSSRPFSA